MCQNLRASFLRSSEGARHAEKRMAQSAILADPDLSAGVRESSCEDAAVVRKGVRSGQHHQRGRQAPNVLGMKRRQGARVNPRGNRHSLEESQQLHRESWCDRELGDGVIGPRGGSEIEYGIDQHLSL